MTDKTPKSDRPSMSRRYRDDVPPCVVEGCSKPGRGNRGRCYTCASRARLAYRKEMVAKGEWEAKLTPTRLLTRSDGYVYGYAPDHPLAMSNGYVLEHRRAAFEKYGPGRQACHWCSCDLDWKIVEVDHMDWDRTNNSTGNLVTACKMCNITRKRPPTEQESGAMAPPSPQQQKMRNLLRRLND